MIELYPINKINNLNYKNLFVLSYFCIKFPVNNYSNSITYIYLLCDEEKSAVDFDIL